LQVFPRQNVAGCSLVQAKMVSYCDAHDTFCSNGPENATGIAIHLGYIPEYGTDAVNFVLAKVKASTVPVTISAGVRTEALSLLSTAAAGVFLVAFLHL
jgi:hypothetical protein